MKNAQEALLDRPPETAVRMLALALLDDATAAARQLRSDTEAAALVVSGGEERFYLVKNGFERELEEESSRAVFERIWSLTKDRQVLKRSYRIAEGDRIWEVDDFFDRDLLIAEAELHGSRQPGELPDWLRPHVVREVTGEDPQRFRRRRIRIRIR